DYYCTSYAGSNTWLF
nr:immunoglobulin light chain junction region [Macaca mulatta]MOW27376.1 immunoglobulin light chain junction region [Macaca mulatta]MOW27632.1 immunoglobulin light chain junction region [Macaca mulatta]MOW27814.1 immunoglobulin light chain junction region [Macaca mulatta]MOW27885.1 immunoglobulin light chain junction region [Macaca mulatta]